MCAFACVCRKPNYFKAALNAGGTPCQPELLNIRYSRRLPLPSRNLAKWCHCCCVSGSVADNTPVVYAVAFIYETTNTCTMTTAQLQWHELAKLAGGNSFPGLETVCVFVLWHTTKAAASIHYWYNCNNSFSDACRKAIEFW